MVEDRDSFCTSKCDKCNICKKMTNVFVEFNYFFYPKTSDAKNYEEIPHQPILWQSFDSVIDKKNKKICIEIGKSIPHTQLVLNYRKTC